MSSMNAVEFLRDFFSLDLGGKMPIQLPMNRVGLAELFNTPGYKSGAEIGVERGEYSEVLLSSNPGLHLSWWIYGSLIKGIASMYRRTSSMDLCEKRTNAPA